MKKFRVTIEQGENTIDLMVSEFGLSSLLIVLSDSNVNFHVYVL